MRLNTKDAIPPVVTWDTSFIQNYVGDDLILRSPRDREAGRSYAMNEGLRGLRFMDLQRPQETVLVFECEFGSPAFGGPELFPTEPRYDDGYLILFADGRVDQIDPDLIDTLIWDPSE